MGKISVVYKLTVGRCSHWIIGQWVVEPRMKESAVEEGGEREMKWGGWGGGRVGGEREREREKERTVGMKLRRGRN